MCVSRTESSPTLTRETIKTSGGKSYGKINDKINVGRTSLRHGRVGYKSQEIGDYSLSSESGGLKIW